MVVQVSRLQDGSRKIISIAEVRGVVGDRVDVHDVFLFERLGLTDAGKVKGRFRSSGEIPKILQRLKVSGIEVPPQIFDEVVDVWCKRQLHAEAQIRKKTTRSLCASGALRQQLFFARSAARGRRESDQSDLHFIHRHSVLAQIARRRVFVVCRVQLSQIVERQRVETRGRRIGFDRSHHR